eukprot:4683281-Amphidinium_carterae.1
MLPSCGMIQLWSAISDEDARPSNWGIGISLHDSCCHPSRHKLWTAPIGVPNEYTTSVCGTFPCSE